MLVVGRRLLGPGLQNAITNSDDAFLEPTMLAQIVNQMLDMVQPGVVKVRVQPWSILRPQPPPPLTRTQTHMTTAPFPLTCTCPSVVVFVGGGTSQERMQFGCLGVVVFCCALP